MLSDYNNPYFYQAGSNMKSTNPYIGYQYPTDSCDSKYNPNLCPGQMCDYQPPLYYPYPTMCTPNPPPSGNSQDQPKTDYVDPPIVKYEYQEPEENFISIDELQYNPTLLKMILPKDTEPEQIKQQIQTGNSKMADIAKEVQTVVKVKEEPKDDCSLETSSVTNTADNVAGAISSEFPGLVSVKLEKEMNECDGGIDMGEDACAMVIKPDPNFSLAFLADSDEEIDENEEGEEFNWMDLEEREKQEFECRFCGKTVSSSYNLRRHMMIHTDNKPFGCDICLKSFREFSDLKKHRRSHRNDPRYKCMICRENPPVEKDGAKCSSCFQHKTSPYGSTFLDEMPVIEGFGGADRKSFVCPECGRVFASRHNLRRHYMIHTGAKPYPCDVCDKSFREVSTLKKHMLTHSRMKSFKCLVCDRDYNDYQAFVKHKNQHGDNWNDAVRKPKMEKGDDEMEDNGQDYLFQCNDCRMRFSDVDLYKRHLRIHSTYFTFQCYVCKMTFKKCEKLISHMITHSYEVSDSE